MSGRTGKYVPHDWSGVAGMRATLREEHERGDHAGAISPGGVCTAREGEIACPYEDPDLAHGTCDKCKAQAIASRVCSVPHCDRTYRRCAEHGGYEGIRRSLHSHQAVYHPRQK